MDPLLEMLGWDRVSVCRTDKNGYHVQNVKQTNAPYMQDLFSVRDFSYSIRNFKNILLIPKPRTNFLKRSFGYSGAVLYRLPSEVRKPLTLTRFRKGINDCCYTPPSPPPPPPPRTHTNTLKCCFVRLSV